MISIQGIWALLKPQGEYKRRYKACDRLWTGYSPDMQQRIYDAVREAQQRGAPISPNPYFAIEDTAPSQGVVESLSGDGRVMLASGPRASKHLTITGPSSDKQPREVQRKNMVHGK